MAGLLVYLLGVFTGAGVTWCVMDSLADAAWWRDRERDD